MTDFKITLQELKKIVAHAEQVACTGEEPDFQVSEDSNGVALLRIPSISSERVLVVYLEEMDLGPRGVAKLFQLKNRS
jgi:hypothetical protein